MLGASTSVVNGERFLTPTRPQYYPTGYGPQTTGVPQVSPSMPPFLGGSPTNNSMVEGVNGFGTAGNNSYVAAQAAEHPHSLRLSPVWWAVGLLLLSIYLLRHVHWRDTMEAGGEGGVHLGPISVGGGAEVESE